MHVHVHTSCHCAGRASAATRGYPRLRATSLERHPHLFDDISLTIMALCWVIGSLPRSRQRVASLENRAMASSTAHHLAGRRAGGGSRVGGRRSMAGGGAWRAYIMG